ncbi:hypothetical protein CEXT_387451 [Caerostris extrusa]|uniref:Uncharacterized protein n=1 Tax=Caerostris extrusa TaxID=172846 RepID=A0AAV4P155_CAEEX|nr:hypothetical protein CEXT_387451 [Caerostris extrusa]
MAALGRPSIFLDPPLGLAVLSGNGCHRYLSRDVLVSVNPGNESGTHGNSLPPRLPTPFQIAEFWRQSCNRYGYHVQLSTLVKRAAIGLMSVASGIPALHVPPSPYFHPTFPSPL